MSKMNKSQRALISAVIIVMWVAVALIPGPRKVSASTFTVTNTSDCAGVGCGSLRQAIIDANAASGGTITFAAGVSGTIDLLLPLDNLNSDITINGPGASVLTVERSFAGGTPDFRVFTIDTGKTVSISGLTIKNGNLIGVSGGGIASFGTLTISNCTIANNAANSGGGIWNAGMVTINNCTVADNSASFGGGVENFGTLTVNNSTVVNNSAAGVGGGIFNRGGGTMTLTNCSVTNNSIQASFGGGIFNAGILTIINSTLARNISGAFGGGIHNLNVGVLMIRNSTIANNSAPQGGGIINEGGTVTLSNCTVANNSANFGGGITNFSNLLNLQSTIVAKNTGTNPDVSGTLTSFGHNLIGDTTGSTGSDVSQGDLINLDPLFQLDDMGRPLVANNGGPTATIALLAGSPAIDHGQNGLALTTDQRGLGFVRTYDDPAVSNGSGDGTDIGAFEVQPLFFDLCLQDDSNSVTALLINTQTGDYRFCCGGQTFTGRGIVLVRGSQVSLQDFGTDRRVLANVDRPVGKGTASIQSPPGRMLCTIIDRNINNSSCQCAAP